MHGASCAERERTAGPEGAARGKRVSRFTFRSVEPRHANGRKTEEKDEFARSSLFCSCVCALKMAINSASPLHLRHQATTALLPLSVHIYRNSAECIKRRRVTAPLITSLTDLTFSSAPIFLPAGGAEASLGSEVTCLTRVMIDPFGLYRVNSFLLATVILLS